MYFSKLPPRSSRLKIVSLSFAIVLWSDEHDHDPSWIPRFASGFDVCKCAGFSPYTLTLSNIAVQDLEGIWRQISTDLSPYRAAGNSKPNVVFDKQQRRLIRREQPLIKSHKYSKQQGPVRILLRCLRNGSKNP